MNAAITWTLSVSLVLGTTGLPVLRFGGLVVMPDTTSESAIHRTTGLCPSMRTLASATSQ